MNRAKLAADFAETTSPKHWKTFVLEPHAPDVGADLLTDAFETSRVEPTEEVYLHRLVGDVSFVVDSIDRRI